MNAAQNFDPTDTTLEQVRRRENLARSVLETIRDDNISQPRQGPTFTPAQASDLVHRSTSAIRTAELEGRLPEQKRNTQNRRENYTLEQLDKMREVFGTRPWRHPSDEPLIIPVQNFKGGVGKTTLSVHLAQYFAIHGYRTLLIDVDAQASATMMFGYIPDLDIDIDQTALPSLLKGDEEVYSPLKDSIRKTHYHNLDLVPANLHLYNAEYMLASRMAKLDAEESGKVLTALRDEVNEVAQGYDVVILDPPPALGMLSMSALLAANALLVPMPPNTIDFSSTASFFSMLRQNMEDMESRGVGVDYRFIQIALTRTDENKWAQQQVVDMARELFGGVVMPTEIKTSAEFDNSSSSHQSVYDLTRPTTNHQVRKRCLKQLNDLGAEVEALVRSVWPNTPAID